MCFDIRTSLWILKISSDSELQSWSMPKKDFPVSALKVWRWNLHKCKGASYLVPVQKTTKNRLG